MQPSDLVRSWGKILTGRIPVLSIEVTKECPLHCPGCYAYGESHLNSQETLRSVSDYRGDALVAGILALVDRHQPLHVSLVGGEPLVRHRELSRVLPELSRRGIFTMVVTSAVTPIPTGWMELPRTSVAVSVDGLPKDHDVRRKPATYERILRNIAGRRVNIHWTIVRAHAGQPGYLEEYVAFWSARPEVNQIWCSLYSPQRGEQAPEILMPADREMLATALPELSRRYPKFRAPEGFARAFTSPPRSPSECLFSRMSVNYTADLNTRVEPCVFGGEPDCSQCGCSASAALHWIGSLPVLGPLRVRHLVRASMSAGVAVNRFRAKPPAGLRWNQTAEEARESELVQIE